MDKRSIVILSGMFARSNMGMGRPEIHEVQALKQATDNITPYDSAIHFCAQFMESEEHEQIFREEAEMWAEVLEKQTDEEIRIHHPDLMQLFDEV